MFRGLRLYAWIKFKVVLEALLCVQRLLSFTVLNRTSKLDCLKQYVRAYVTEKSLPI